VLRRLAIALAILACTQTARAQGAELAAARCLALGADPPAAVAAVYARWLHPRPVALTFAASVSFGPVGEPYGSVVARADVSRWSPFHVAVHARALVGARSFVVVDALVGFDLARRRGTSWRGGAGDAAPWDLQPPTDPARVEDWLRARADDCALSQGAWRILGGARLLMPLDGVDAAPTRQFAVTLGAARVASTWAGGTLTGLDLGLFALFDPQRLAPGVVGRVGTTWNRVFFGLEGAWLLGAQGYGYVALDIGLRLSL
jgi:hypothetical protein